MARFNPNKELTYVKNWIENVGRFVDQYGWNDEINYKATEGTFFYFTVINKISTLYHKKFGTKFN